VEQRTVTENEHFVATLKRGKERQIILTPKEKGLSAMISRIVISLSPDRPGVIKSVRIVESERNYTPLFVLRCAGQREHS